MKTRIRFLLVAYRCVDRYVCGIFSICFFYLVSLDCLRGTSGAALSEGGAARVEMYATKGGNVLLFICISQTHKHKRMPTTLNNSNTRTHIRFLCVYMCVCALLGMYIRYVEYSVCLYFILICLSFPKQVPCSIFGLCNSGNLHTNIRQCCFLFTFPST